MTLIYQRDLPAELVVPKMRTEVPYRRPSISSEFGHYISKTVWHPRGYLYCQLETHLVWFNQLGWYHTVQFESHWDAYGEEKQPLPAHRARVMYIDFAPNSPTWHEGALLPLCAQDADEAGLQLIEVRKIPLPLLGLSPYVTYEWYLKNCEVYLLGNRAVTTQKES